MKFKNETTRRSRLTTLLVAKDIKGVRSIKEYKKYRFSRKFENVCMNESVKVHIILGVKLRV